MKNQKAFPLPPRPANIKVALFEVYMSEIFFGVFFSILSLEEISQVIFISIF